MSVFAVVCNAVSLSLCCVYSVLNYHYVQCVQWSEEQLQTTEHTESPCL